MLPHKQKIVKQILNKIKSARLRFCRHVRLLSKKSFDFSRALRLTFRRQYFDKGFTFIKIDEFKYISFSCYTPLRI